MTDTGILDQWIRYSSQDWAFLIALCALAVWMQRSALVRDAIANWFPVILALLYGITQAMEAGYGFGTFLMFKGVTLAAGTVAAQSIAEKIVPQKKSEEKNT
jgi:hypothetical protein